MLALCMGRASKSRLTRLAPLVWDLDAATGGARGRGCLQCHCEQCTGCRCGDAEQSRAPVSQWEAVGSRDGLCRDGLWRQMGSHRHCRGLATQVGGGDSSHSARDKSEIDMEAARVEFADMERGEGDEAVERVELPIGAAEPPKLPSNETPISRLLGSQGMATLQRLRGEASPGRLGPSVTSAIQELEMTEGKAGKRSAAEGFDEVLESWQTMLEEGDYEGVMSQMGERGGDVASILAPLQRDKAKMDKEALRAKRRVHEEELRASFAAKRVRLVDELGRAYATGKKKTSIARVWLRAPSEDRPGLGRIRVNGRPFDDYFKPILARMEVMKPFELTRTLGAFDVRANVHGGGVSGQATALRHGIAKALQWWDPEVRPVLKAAGLLTRDSRIVERKKPGKAKARKSFQWVKR